MKIIIDETEYFLNVKQAIDHGVLSKVYPLRVGDVYTDPKKEINDFLLVQVTYEPETFQLLALSGGFAPNSELFFNKAHTLKEIGQYLSSYNMGYKKNVVSEFSKVFRA